MCTMVLRVTFTGWDAGVVQLGNLVVHWLLNSDRTWWESGSGRARKLGD